MAISEYQFSSLPLRVSGVCLNGENEHRYEKLSPSDSGNVFCSLRNYRVRELTFAPDSHRLTMQ